MMKVLLASKSPRRKELLQNLGVSFDTVAIDCNEVYPNHLKIEHIAAYLSELKAHAFRNLSQDEVLITADTIVASKNEVLGKPENETHAFEMLKKLSGKTHEVYTGVTIKTIDKEITKTDVAHVQFSDFTDQEINFYINHYKPFDKAGSYGIQEWLGMAKISKISGSFYTIMGLPTHLIYEELKNLNLF